MGQPSYVCSVLFARVPVLGLCFFVSVSFGLTRIEREITASAQRGRLGNNASNRI